MQHNTKFDEAYNQAFAKANWSAMVRYMQVTHINADENDAKSCANQAYSDIIRNGNCLESCDVGGVRVEFFIYNNILFCRISFNPQVTESTGYFDL